MDSTVTDRQLIALINGEARIYRDRVIPVIRGGSGLEAEAVAVEAPAEAVETPAEPGETPAEQGTEETATEEAPAFTPEQITALREHPEFRDFLAQEAAQIADARLDERLRQQNQGATETPAAPDLSDPFSEDFGANLLSAIEQVVTRIVAPIQQTNEAAQSAAREAGLVETIQERTKAAGLPDNASTTVRRLAEGYAPELFRQYGPNRGGEMALDQAIREILALTGDAARNGGQSRIDELNAVRNAPGGLPGNGAAVSLPPPAGSPTELLNRTFGMNFST